MTGYDTPGPIRAVLDLSAARLWINAGARADTQVRIDPANPDSPEDVKAAQRIQADYTEGELTVRGAQGTWGSWLSSGGLAEVVLDLPAGSSLEVRTSAGDIRAYGRLGDVTAHTSHGEIALTRTGNARLSTESGGIRLGVARGAVELRAPDGDIHVEEVTGELNAGTAGGASPSGGRTPVSPPRPSTATSACARSLPARCWPRPARARWRSACGPAPPPNSS